MRLDWDAAYLDGRTAARRPASVHITRTGIDIALRESATRFFWPFREIRQTQGAYAGEQVRLERGGDLAEVLLVGDIGFLSAARAASPEAAHLHEPGRRRFRVGLTFGALLAAAAPRPERRLLGEDDWNNVKSLCGELPEDSRSPQR